MDIRERVLRHPAIAVGVVALVLVLIVLVAVVAFSGDSPGSSGGGGGGAFYTVDDGKSYFEGPLDRIPPFKTEDGQTAYRAHVARCGTGAPFVSHLEKYSDEDKRRWEEFAKAGGTRSPAGMRGTLGTSPLVKKPGTGDDGWIAITPQTSNQYLAITRPTCPDGSPAEPVTP